MFVIFTSKHSSGSQSDAYILKMELSARELLYLCLGLAPAKDRWGEIGVRRVPTTRRTPKRLG
jgi:hypothetical protein